MTSNAELTIKDLKRLLDRHGIGDLDASLLTRVRGLINKNIEINRDRARLVHQKVLRDREIRHLNSRLENRPAYNQITDEQVIEIVYRHEDGETYRELAQEYKVSSQTIGRIVRAYKKEIA